jgi:hypothetical protein
MAYYSDKLSQVTADGAIVLAQGAVPIALTQAVQGNILTSALLQHRIARSISDGYVDIFEDDSGIDYDASCGITFDAENKHVDTSLSASVIFPFDSAGTITRQDLKDTITYWEKTSSGKGRFKTAVGGSVVTVGDWTDGAHNLSTTNTIPTQTEGGNTSTNSARGGTAAWMAVDGSEATEWLAGDLYYVSPRYSLWWLFDFGAGNEKIINKFRVKNDGVWQVPTGGLGWWMEGSNNGTGWTEIWDTYKSRGSYTSANGWTPWFTFVNATPYRYYRLCWDGDVSQTDSAYINIWEIQMVEAVPIDNLSVIPGTLLNDLRTVCYIDGDGSASDSVWLDSDLASGTVSSIYGLKFVDGKVQPNQVDPNPHGVTNSSTTNGVPIQSGDGAATASSTYNDGSSQAWRAANHSTSGYWMTDNLGQGGVVDPVNAWWKIDLGEGQEKQFNRFRWHVRLDFSPPRRWKIQASNNNSDWTDLYTVYVSQDFTAGAGWTSWFDFSNTTEYRYYRFFVISTDSYIIVNEFEFVEAQPLTYPSPAVAITEAVNTETWTAISSGDGSPVEITEVINGDSSTYYSVTLNYGESDEIWYGSGFSGIARLNNGTWEYMDEDWVSAPTNERFSALSVAFVIQEASLGGPSWFGSENYQWEGITGPYTAWAVCLVPDGDDVPTTESIELGYVASTGELVSVPWTTQDVANKASITFFVGGLVPGDTIGAFARSDDNAEWTLLDISRVAQNVTASGIDQYSSTIVTLSGTTGTSYSTKLLSDGVAVKWYGVCGMYGD